MTLKSKLIQKTVLYLTGLLTLIFILTFTLGQEANIEFKNPQFKKVLYIILTFALPISFILTSIILWRLIEDTFETKFTISIILLAFATWASFKYVETLIFFDSKHWYTNNIITSSEHSKHIYRVEQEKVQDFLFYKRHKRIIQATSFFGIFWKIEHVEIEATNN